MAGVRIVTDSACDLPQDLVDRHGIAIVPLSIRFGDEEFVDRIDLSASEFYKRMAAASDLGLARAVETAAGRPSPAALEDVMPTVLALAGVARPVASSSCMTGG